MPHNITENSSFKNLRHEKDSRPRHYDHSPFTQLKE